MSEQQRLRQMLEQLHAELQQSHGLDDRSRERLASALSDIEDLLKRAETGKPPESIVERLHEAIGVFEQTHPTLTAAIGRVADTLANMGISPVGHPDRGTGGSGGGPPPPTGPHAGPQARLPSRIS